METIEPVMSTKGKLKRPRTIDVLQLLAMIAGAAGLLVLLCFNGGILAALIGCVWCLFGAVVLWWMGSVLEMLWEIAQRTGAENAPKPVDPSEQIRQAKLVEAKRKMGF